MKLKKLIRKIKETTTTGDVAGYSSKYAWAPKGKFKKKKNASFIYPAYPDLFPKDVKGGSLVEPADDEDEVISDKRSIKVISKKLKEVLEGEKDSSNNDNILLIEPKDNLNLNWMQVMRKKNNGDDEATET